MKSLLYRFLFTNLILITGFTLFALPVRADVTTALESQINIITQEYSTNSSTAAPTDNSLGLIEWDSTKYNDAAVYFEAVIYCDSCTGGNTSALAGLYTDTGTLVTDSALSSSAGSYARYRSDDIISDLDDNQDYTVRLSLDATSGTAYIHAARLIVVQSGTSITDHLNHIELGTNTTTTDTDYQLITAPKIYLYDSDRHSHVQNIFFESTLKGSDAAATAYAALSSSASCSSTVSGSEVSVTGTDWARARSGNISANLSTGTQYWVCLKTTDADTGSIANAKLIIEQSSNSSISDIELVHHHITYPVQDSNISYTSQSFLNYFDPDNFSAQIINYYFESNLQTSSTSTGSARLYNVSSTTPVNYSEVSTDANAYSRVRSGQLHLYMPSSAALLDTQLKNSTTETTTASSSWLIIWLHQIPDTSFTFTVSGVSAGQTHNGITASETSTYTELPFSNLTFSTPKYVAHSLSATTNAASGYTVTMSLINFMQGIYPGNNIDPFISTWSHPTTWTEPTGTTPNIDTGWLGANTTDTRVSGWDSADQKFGPVSSAPVTVMYGTGPDTGTTAYVTFALEVNILQPADAYSGALTYTVLPNY